MKIRIEHEIKGRIRFSTSYGILSAQHADRLEYYLLSLPGVQSAKVYTRSGNAVVCYTGPRTELLQAVCRFSPQDEAVRALVPEHTSRALNEAYREKLVGRVAGRLVFQLLAPAPLRAARACVQALSYVRAGLRCLCRGRLEVPVLDAAAITVSLARRDFSTASSVMFLLGIGELMEEWTHKRSVADLASSMALNVEKVWVKTPQGDVLMPVRSVQQGACIRMEVGTMIPLDGVVAEGEAMVNQASLTGESVPVKKGPGSAVYAGTVLEEGALTIEVRSTQGGTRYEKIVAMIEESERLKSSLEGKAAHLADKLVPISFFGTVLTGLLTRNVQKTVSILMVDFSCALKLSMPLAVLSAMRECSQRRITVKGGRFLEALAEADTVVFDKTGTLTKGVFSVTAVHPHEIDKAQLVELAALAESYSTHPIAASLRTAYGQAPDTARVADYEELSGRGVRAKVDGRTVCVGNGRLMDEAGAEWHECHLTGTVAHVAVDGRYAGHIVISDEVKPDAAAAIAALKAAGVHKTVMLTGDAKEVGEAVAKQLGIDEAHTQLLPAGKVEHMEQLLAGQPKGEALAFVGDGVNDAPVLARADVGIAMGGIGSDAAIEAADVVLMDDKPSKLAEAVRISRRTLRIVHQNIVFALAVKALVLVLGALGMANMWEAVFADVGVMVLAILNAMRALKAPRE